MEAVGRLLRAAREEGVRSFVHTSTVLGLPPFRPAPVNGTAGKLTIYEETKRAADDLVRAHAAAGFPIVTVRPTRVYGPGPLNDANGVTQLLDLYLRGRFRVRLSDGDVEANYVYVEDVAEGIVRAASFGRPGGDYLLGGDNISFRGFLETVARVSGVRRRVLAIPWRAGMGLGAAGEFWGRLGGSPSLTRGWIRVFLEDRRADISAAQRDLGYRPRSLEQGLSQTLCWLRTRETEVGS
jgi:farnesol dehydrogenase